MANEHSLTASSREDAGKGASRRLRHAAKIPAIVYGGGAEPQSVQLDHEPVWLASQHDWFYSSIISLSVDGKAQNVLLRDMQRHPYRQLILHLDFQRVKANEKLHVKVPVHLKNVETSVAGKTAGVAVTLEMNDIDVICLPRHLPEAIEVDLGQMQPGDTVYLADVTLPEGVELAHKVDDTHNPAVAVARYVKEEPEVVDEDVSAEVPASRQDAGEDAGAADSDAAGE